MGKKKLPKEVLDFFRKEGAKGGRLGAKRVFETMTAEERTARAKKASDVAAKLRSKKAAAKKRSQKNAKY